MSEAKPSAKRRTSRWRLYLRRRRLGAALMAVVGVSVALLLFVLGAGVRLLIGPVSLGPFAGALSGALAEALPGITMKYDQAAIEWSREEGKVSLVILGTRVFDQAGRIIAQAPKADIDLAAAPIIEGRAVVRRITLVGVQLTLVRGVDGKLVLGLGDDRRERDIIDRIAETLSKSKGPSHLQGFAVRKARFALYDEGSQLFLVSPRADFALSAAGGGALNARLEADIELSGHSATVSGHFTFPAQGERIDGHLTVHGFSLAALAAGSPSFARLKGTDVRADLECDFALRGAKLNRADFTVNAQGAFALPSVDGRVHMQDLRVEGRYEGASARLTLVKAHIRSDKINGEFSGRMDIPRAAGVPMDFDLRGRHLALELPGLFGAKLDFPDIALRGAWNETARALAITRLYAGGGVFAIKAAGQLLLPREEATGIAIKGEIGALGVRDLVRYWPLHTAGGARAWVEKNMPTGRVGPIVFDIRIPPGALDAPALAADMIDVRFPLQGVEARYIDGLSHLSGLRGKAKLTGVDFAIDVQEGQIGPLAVSGGRFAIADLTTREQVGVVTAHVQGTMADVLTLIDMKPLRYSSRFGIDVGSVKGNAALDLSFTVPLRKDVEVDAVAIAIKARTSGFALSLGRTIKLTDGTLDFVVDNTKLRAGGTVGLGGSASKVTVDWAEEFSAAKAATRVALKGTLDATARASLGLPLADAFRGPMGVSGTIAGRHGALKEGALQLDLTPLAVTINPIGVNKPAGLAMGVKLALGFGERSQLETLGMRLSGSGSAVAATARFDADGRLLEVQAPQVRLGPRNDFALSLTHGADGMAVDVRGHSLDGSRLMQRAADSAAAPAGGGGGSVSGGGGSAGGAGEASEPLRLTMRLDHLVLRDGVSVNNLGLDAAFAANDQLTALTLSGNFGKNAALAAALSPGADARRMNVSVGDAGQLFKGLYGFSSIRGGKLSALIQLPNLAAGRDAAPVDFSGKLTITDFRIVDQPFLTRLFSAGSLTGLVNLMQGQGITVDEFDVPFVSKGRVIAVSSARARGPAVGVTADGYLDRPKNEIALKGTLVPLFGLNSVLGNIPLIGDVLTSKEGEGIFGMSYEVKGNADEPTVSVNPLSVLAPGILRRIFEGKLPTAPQTPPKAAQSATSGGAAPVGADKGK